MPAPQTEKPWEALRQRAADPNAVTFVRPTGEIDVFQRGEFDDEQRKNIEARGLKAATPEDIEKRAKHLENATTEQQTRAAIELGLNTATAGAIGKEDFGAGAGERREALETESPGVALGARIVGGAVPMALTGGAAGALGAGGAVLGAAEGIGVGLAEENAQAAWENRDLSAGNVALAGLGGALFGGAIPAVLRRGSKALGGAGDAVAAAAGEVGENLAPRLEASATARAARNVSDMAPGPARDAVLRQGAKQHLERAGAEIQDVATRAGESMAKADLDKATLKRLMPKDAPVQTQWATRTAEDLRAMAGKVAPEPVPSAAPNLAGKSLEDLKALPIEGADDLARVKSLRENADFAKTGKVTANDAAHGITIVDDGGEMVLRDGRHRLTAAQELGRDTVHGRYVDGKTGKVLFEGEIPLKAQAAAAPAPHTDVFRKVADSLLESKGGLDTLQRARAGMAELRAAGAPPEAIDALRKGVTDQSLFGRAAEAVDDFERGLAKAPGKPLEGFDPENLTQAAREQLTSLAESLEDRAAARAKWDMKGGKDTVAKRLTADASRVRKALALADDVAGARGREAVAGAAGAAPAAAAAPKAAGGGFAQDLIAEAGEFALEKLIGGVIPGAGLAIKVGRRMWSGIDAAGRESIRQAARGAARGALGAAESGVAGVRRIAPTALEHFAGDFPGPQEAFIARRDMLLEMARDPTVLPNALAESFGDLPREDPKLFSQIATRMAKATAYVTANLPAGVATSMTHPRGVKPSRDTLRDFAVVWNSAMHPETVIDSVEDGSASPEQIRALKTVDPDAYQTLVADVTSEVGQSYEQVTSQTKQWLDILFDSDGIAGPAYSWAAADYMAEAEKARGGKPMPMGQLPPPSEQAPAASGINAIKAGVTNRPGGA